MANQKVWELYLWLRADIDWLKKDLANLNKKVSSQAKRTWQSIWKEISNWIMWAIGKLGGIIAAFEGIRKSLDLSWILEQNQVAFETLLWSAERAQRMMKELTDFAKNTPFELLGLQDTAKQLIGMGFEAKQVIPTLQILGDAVSAVGAWQEGLQRVVRALVQIKAKGKLSAEEMMQLAETWLPVYDILREKLHLTGKEMANLWNAWIKAGDAIQAIMEGLQERYQGMMEAQSKTFKGMLSNLKDSIDIFLAEIWKSLLPRIKEWLSVILDFFAKWWKFLASEIWKTLTTIFGGAVEFASSVVNLFKKVFSILWKDNQKAVKWIGLNWQSLFYYLRTWFRTIVFIAKAVVKTIWWFFGMMATAVKKIFAKIVNYFVDKINFLIDGFNALWDKFWFTFDKLEKVSWWAGEDISKSMKLATSSIMKDWWDLTFKMAYDYLQTTKKIEEANKTVWFSAKKFTFDVKWLYTVFNKAFSWIWQTTWAVKQQFKELIDKVNNTTKSISSWLSKQLNLYDKVKEKLIKIKEKYEDWKKTAHDAILSINHDLASLDQEKNNQLAERYVEIQKELQETLKKTEELKQKANQEEQQKQQRLIELQNRLNILLQKQAEFTDKTKESTKLSIQNQIQSIQQQIEQLKTQSTNLSELSELEQKRIQLEKELQIIKQNAPEQILKEKEAYDKLTESQRILYEYEKKRQQLLEQKAIYEAIEGQKGLLENVIQVKEQDWQLTAEYFDKQKQQWIEITNWENIQLAVRLENKRQALLQETQIQLDALEQIKQATQNQTEELKQIWSNYNNYLKIDTANTVAKLLTEYQRIVNQLKQVYLWQKKTKTASKWHHMWWLVKWFATGWFTGWNTPLKPAWIVHQGEYVIPKWMTDTYRWLVGALEKIRIWQSTSIVNQNKNFTVSEIVINQDVDILNELNRFNWLY